MKTDRIRIGILGCSNIARRRFLPGLARAGNAVLTAIASRDPGKARSFFPGAAYDALEYEELLRHRDVDLVYISLPNDLHEEWTLRALEAGKHVLCEKPMGLSPASVDRMISLAEQKGLLACESMAYLHHPQQAAARDLIAGGVIGTVRMLRTAYGFTLTAQEDFRLHAEQGGGAFHDLARYPLSAALFFLQGRISAFRGHALCREGLNIAMDASAVTSAGERLVLSIGFAQSYECWYEIVGDKGRLRVNRPYSIPADQGGQIELCCGSDQRTIPVLPNDHFTRMIEHACSCILEGTQYGRAHEAARRLAGLSDDLLRGCMEIRPGPQGAA